MPQYGIVIVDIEDERSLVNLQDMVVHPVEIEFPKPITIEADEPPEVTKYTGLVQHT